MKGYIDYVYYRIRKWNFKYDKGEGLFAAGAIGLTEGMLFLDAYIIATRLLFSSDQLNKYATISYLPVVAGMGFLSIYNFYAYRDKNKFAAFDDKWKSGVNPERSLKGLLVVITLLVPWVLLYFINGFFNPN